MKGRTNAKTHEEYIAAVEDKRRPDVRRLHELVREAAPGLEPTMEFGMLGYGKYHYKYKSGREGDWMKIGIANNKHYISLYCSSGRARKSSHAAVSVADSIRTRSTTPGSRRRSPRATAARCPSRGTQSVTASSKTKFDVTSRPSKEVSAGETSPWRRSRRFTWASQALESTKSRSINQRRGRFRFP